MGNAIVFEEWPADKKNMFKLTSATLGSSILTFTRPDMSIRVCG